MENLFILTGMFIGALSFLIFIIGSLFFKFNDTPNIYISLLFVSFSILFIFGFGFIFSGIYSIPYEIYYYKVY